MRPPKGFDDAPPAVAELLKHKQLYFYILLDGKLSLTSRLRREVAERFRLLVPFVDWLNEAVLRARIGEEADEVRPKRPEPMW